MTIFKIIIELVIGTGLLAFGADRFIVASASLARHLKIPALIAGIILVGFGTSFPELIVSAIASAHGKAQIAIGNVIGSNIANIGLVLGLATLIAPIKVHSRLIKREFPILIIISVFIGAMLWNGYLSRWEGIILFVILALHFYWISVSVPKNRDPIVAELAQEKPIKMSVKKSIFWWVVGLVVLFGSSELLVDGAVGAAKLIGISDLIIGLTIVTIGTSLPEFAATIISALKKEHDIAIGHIVGSNIFNSLAVLAMPALIAPGNFSPEVVQRDYPIMLAFTIGLWLFTFLVPGKGELGRIFGGIFLLCYIGYLFLLFSG